MNKYDDTMYEANRSLMTYGAKPLQSKKRVTLREVLDAARKNGLSHIRHEFFRLGKHNTTKYYTIAGGCALAQAGFNLGINPWELGRKRIGNYRPFEAIIRL